MMHYAISDGLLGVISFYGAAALLFWSAKAADILLPRRLVAAGLFTITLAAFTGALRFLTANHDLLKPPHLWLSDMAGVVGSLWILFGLLQLRRSLPLPAVGQYLIPPLIFTAALFLGQVQLLVLIASLLLLAGQSGSLIGLFRQGRTAPAIWMLISLLCLVAVFATEVLFQDAAGYAWHYYHSMMAIWVLALIMSVKGAAVENL